MKHPEFQHEAMATTFAIIIAGQRPEYARQAAASAFRALDRLEGELSRFIESSDIARASRLARGGSIVIGEDALQCLLLAEEVKNATGGAFDAGYASGPAVDLPVGGARFTLDPAAHTLTAQVDRLKLDLGAIGKGYALDRMAEHLGEWGVTSACLQSGGSTALALAPPDGAPGWLVGIGDRVTLPLAQAALSGSGIAVQGPHLLDPRTGVAAARTRGVWAHAPVAALADALSTAFFVLPDAGIHSFCLAHPEIGAALLSPDDTLVTHGTLAGPPGQRLDRDPAATRPPGLDPGCSLLARGPGPHMFFPGC
jgi:thiamine biosynthesis lipoprotein